MFKIPIGTMVDGLLPDPAAYISNIVPLGFESIQLTFWQTVGETDLPKLADRVRSILDPLGISVSSVGVYGNPLESDEMAQQTLRGLTQAIAAAPLFGSPVVSCFTGRIRNKPIPDSIPAFQTTFGRLCDIAAKDGTKIAMENCAMGGTWKLGDWNIAHGPDAWEIIFESLPHDNLGLEWETCHQMINLMDPIAQLPLWIDRIFHIHGKCANVHHDIIKKHGIHGYKPAFFHRFPGLGDADWTEVFRILDQNKYRGTIDIEGWHDPVFNDETELEGQVNALNYLNDCRINADVAQR